MLKLGTFLILIIAASAFAQPTCNPVDPTTVPPDPDIAGLIAVASTRYHFESSPSVAAQCTDSTIGTTWWILGLMSKIGRTPAGIVLNPSTGVKRLSFNKNLRTLLVFEAGFSFRIRLDQTGTPIRWRVLDWQGRTIHAPKSQVLLQPLDATADAACTNYLIVRGHCIDDNFNKMTDADKQKTVIGQGGAGVALGMCLTSIIAGRPNIPACVGAGIGGWATTTDPCPELPWPPPCTDDCGNASRCAVHILSVAQCYCIQHCTTTTTTTATTTTVTTTTCGTCAGPNLYTTFPCPPTCDSSICGGGTWAPIDPNPDPVVCWVCTSCPPADPPCTWSGSCTCGVENYVPGCDLPQPDGCGAPCTGCGEGPPPQFQHCAMTQIVDTRNCWTCVTPDACQLPGITCY